ncbi:hypothetical protein F5B18DRAFT_595229 [Nemania serpens]|nr:hypothetical protein F5B18DRAFT_595229 [Nemania serpens]
MNWVRYFILLILPVWAHNELWWMDYTILSSADTHFRRCLLRCYLLQPKHKHRETHFMIKLTSCIYFTLYKCYYMTS